MRSGILYWWFYCLVLAVFGLVCILCDRGLDLLFMVRSCVLWVYFFCVLWLLCAWLSCMLVSSCCGVLMKFIVVWIFLVLIVLMVWGSGWYLSMVVL